MATCNTLKKAKLVQKLTAAHYEPGRQDRCKRAVYRNVVVKVYPMSERTFFRLLSLSVKSESRADVRQLTLF